MSPSSSADREITVGNPLSVVGCHGDGVSVDNTSARSTRCRYVVYLHVVLKKTPVKSCSVAFTLIDTFCTILLARLHIV